MSDGTPKPKRQLRNLLLDPPFQLKYVLWFVSGTLLAAALAGVFIWRAQRALFDEADAAVEARVAAAKTSRELGKAVLSNELLARFDDPAFVAVLQTENQRIDDAYAKENAAIETQRESLRRRQRVALLSLVFAILLLAGVGAATTLVLTHRIAGPVFRLKRMIDSVRVGDLSAPSHGLRRKDEFQELFTLFQGMIAGLRDREARALEQATSALQLAERTGAPAEVVQALAAICQEHRQRTEDP